MQNENKAKIRWALSLTFFVLIFAILTFILSVDSNSSKDSLVITTSQGVEIDAALADDATERQQGLSGRESLADNEGMIFVFDEPGLHGFWMKDMLISIDIIWIDNAKKVVHIEESVAPDTYPDTSFYPSAEALYVLELAGGRAEEIGLGLGDALAFDLR